MIAKIELSLTYFKVDCFYARRLFCEDNIKKEWLILRHFNQESKDSSCLDSSKKMMFFWPKKTVVLMLSWKYLNLIWARFWIWTRHKRSLRAILWNVISVDDIISYSRYIHFKQRSMERDDRDGLSWLYQKLTQKGAVRNKIKFFYRMNQLLVDFQSKNQVDPKMTQTKTRSWCFLSWLFSFLFEFNLTIF